MKRPAHEEISQRAHKIWQDGTDPAVSDHAHGRKAEHHLHATNAAPTLPALQPVAAPARFSAQSPGLIAESVAERKKAAREPKLLHHTSTKLLRAVTAEPLKDRPNSSDF